MTVVLWLLCDRSSIGDDDANCFLPVRPLQDDDEEDICMVQTIMSSFDNYINTTRDITRESTRLLSDRGPKEEKQGRKETKHILMELKNWYKASTRLLESHYLAVGQRKFNCSRYSLSMKSNRSRANSASVFGGADGDEHNKYHEMTPRLINGSVLNDDKSQAYSANSVHNRSKTLSKGENIHAAKSGSTIMQYFDNHTSMADKEAQSSPSYKEVNKPIAKGPIVPIGSSPGKESRPTITQSNNDKIYNDSDLIDVKCQLHEGLQCYRQASKWQESGLLLPEQLSQLKAKKILIDDKFFYPQKWIITKVGPVPQNGNGELSIGRLSTSKFSSHRLKSQQDSYMNPMLDDAYDDYYHSNNFSADSNFSMNSLQPSGRVSEGSSVAQPPGGINLLPEVPFSNDPEYMFFTYAPLINQTQRDALLFSLTSDICTTILVS